MHDIFGSGCFNKIAGCFSSLNSASTIVRLVSCCFLVSTDFVIRSHMAHSEVLGRFTDVVKLGDIACVAKSIVFANPCFGVAITDQMSFDLCFFSLLQIVFLQRDSCHKCRIILFCTMHF